MGTADITIKSLEVAHLNILQEMMYMALFIPEGSTAPPQDIIWEPNLRKYHEHWGKQGDYGLLAEVAHQEAGAIWSRLFRAQDRSYGFVSEDIPEMVIALKPHFRNKGIGTRLIEELQKVLRKQGFSGLSLSVQKENRAIQLYRRLGFQPVKQEGTAYTMLLSW